MGYRYHEAAKLFPEITGDAFEALKADIEKNGQLEPCSRLDGKIIDGRNRIRACKELGVEPWVEDLDPDECPDPFTFVMSINYHRRHLTDRQSGVVFRDWLARAGGAPGAHRGGRPAKGKPAQNGQVSVSSIAREAGVPRQTVQRHIQAAEDYDACRPEIRAKVDAGEMTPKQGRAVTEMAKAALPPGARPWAVTESGGNWKQ